MNKERYTYTKGWLIDNHLGVKFRCPKTYFEKIKAGKMEYIITGDRVVFREEADYNVPKDLSNNRQLEQVWLNPSKESMKGIAE